MRKRKGWYKKAKLRFVLKRVYNYTYEGSGYNSPSITAYEGNFEYKYYTKDSVTFQRIMQIKNKGFIGGFWYARALSKKQIGNFYWSKILKEEVIK